MPFFALRHRAFPKHAYRRSSAGKPKAPSLLSRTLTSSNLFAAWEKVRGNGGMAGVDGQTLAAFEHNVFGRLLTLKHQVEKGEYKPLPLREILIPKPDGGQRRLAVPAVRDRVLQTAVARIITPLLDREFEDASFGYRAGRSVALAVARVAWYRDQGYQWVVDADIQTFFDEIDHTILLGKLRQILPEDSLLPLIQLWLAAILQPDGGQPRLLTKGVPQGSPLSPLLSNLYLDGLDEALLGNDLRLVRFADDFLILCRDRNQAERALALTQDLLESLALRLKPEKTRITHFDEGFRFLGVDFIRNLMQPADPQISPWVIPDEEDLRRAAPSESDEVKPLAPSLLAADGASPSKKNEPDGPPDEENGDAHLETWISIRTPPPPPLERPVEEDSLHQEHIELEQGPPLEPLLRGLVITGHGHVLRKDGERLMVSKDRLPLVSIPLHKLDYVLVHGNQLVSTALFRHAAEHGLNWVFADSVGRVRASLQLHDEAGLALHRHQFERERDENFRLMLARAFVRGKINNQTILLVRLNRTRRLDEVHRATDALRLLIDRLTTAPSIDHVRGIEGHAAHLYFRALGAIIPESWQFSGRRRQPPTDPFNVLLSYGYGLLFSALHTLVERRGLNPYLGSLHTANGRHAALVSDLMEEFRAPLVDQTALQTLLTRFKPEDFIWDAQADLPCRLSESARKEYLARLQERLRAVTIHPRARQRMDAHRLMHYQVHHYARVVVGDERVYHPYLLR